MLATHTYGMPKAELPSTLYYPLLHVSHKLRYDTSLFNCRGFRVLLEVCLLIIALAYFISQCLFFS